jgi:hypothetical protein
MTGALTGKNRMLMKLYIALLTLVVLLVTPVRAGAEDYNVNAVVPYPVPSQAATITSPVAGTVHVAQQTVTRSCQAANPPIVVSIWRDGSLLGSGVCTSGTYNIPIILAQGSNQLIAKTANVDGQYGPDSDTVVVALTQPVVVQPLPPSVQQPSSPEQQVTATNAGSLAGLVVATEKPFTLLGSGKNATVQVVVKGGQEPYALRINWGDGSVEMHSISLAGEYEYAHTYQNAKSYSAIMSVRDVRGAFSQYAHAVIATQPTALQSKETASKQSQTSVDSHAVSIWTKLLYGFLLIFVLFFLLSSYWPCWRRANRYYENNANKIAVTKRRNKKKS